MSKNLPCIKLNDDAINSLRDYFFNNYNGEEFSEILKGSFIIKLFDNNREFKILVKQEKEDTSLSLLSSKDEKIIVTALLHGNKLKYNYKEHSYITRSSVGGITSKENQKELISFQKQIIDIYSYLVVFFSKEKDIIPYSVSFYKLKKKNMKKSFRIYNISKKLVKEKTKPCFTIFDYENLNMITQIKTSICFLEKLENIMVEENIPFEEPLFIPFREFLVSLDGNITEIYCKVNEEKKILECVVYKSKIKALALEISLEKDPNRNFKIYTFDEFDKLNNQYNEKSFTIAKKLIHIMIVNFFYFTHYKIILDKNNPETKVVTRHNIKNNNNRNDSYKRNVYLSLNPKRRVYNIENSVNENAAKRKKPEYRKFSWQVRGHFRHLKSGKKIWIAPYSCNRKNKSESNTDKSSCKNYIINV